MRIAGTTIPNKHLAFALTALFGIGVARARAICKETKIDPATMADTLTPAQENEIRRVIETLKLGGDLKREVAQNIKRLKDIGSYRGGRHSKRLPTRGQRTKTNSRTLRGNVRKTMGSGRRKTEKT